MLVNTTPYFLVFRVTHSITLYKGVSECVVIGVDVESIELEIGSI